MKEPRPPYARVVLGVPCCFCAECATYRRRADFYAVALAKQARCCKSCWKAKQRRRRSGTPAARMLHTLKNRLRAEGNGALARRWELGDVERVLRRAGWRAGATEPLSVVRRDPCAPLCPDNAATTTRVATAATCRVLMSSHTMRLATTSWQTFS